MRYIKIYEIYEWLELDWLWWTVPFLIIIQNWEIWKVSDCFHNFNAYLTTFGVWAIENKSFTKSFQMIFLDVAMLWLVQLIW